MPISKKKIINLFIALSLALSLGQMALVGTAEAETMWEKAQNGGLKTIGNEAYESGGNPTDIRIIVSRIIKVFLGFLGIIFTALIIAAGYKYMTAQGNDSQIEDALSQIKTGVIGLLIVMAAFGIATFVTSGVYKATTGLNP